MKNQMDLPDDLNRPNCNHRRSRSASVDIRKLRSDIRALGIIRELWRPQERHWRWIRWRISRKNWIQERHVDADANERGRTAATTPFYYLRCLTHPLPSSSPLPELNPPHLSSSTLDIRKTLIALVV